MGQVVRQRKKNRFFYFFFFFFFDFSVSPSINFTILFKSHRYLYLFYSIFSFLMEFSSLSRPLVCDSIASTSPPAPPFPISLSRRWTHVLNHMTVEWIKKKKRCITYFVIDMNKIQIVFFLLL